MTSNYRTLVYYKQAVIYDNDSTPKINMSSTNTIIGG